MKSIALSLLPAVAVFCLAACDAAAPPAGNGVARVNGRQIVTLPPVEGQLTLPPRAALDRLIDQALLAEQAQQLRLDREPAVAGEIELARQRILARAYVDRHMLRRSAAENEIVRYYQSHPALFAERRIYRYEELVLARPGPPPTEMRTRLGQPGTFEDMAVWLTGRGIAFRRGGGIRAAEQLPSELLPQLAAMNEGQIALVQGEAGVSLVRLLQAQAAPLGLAEARPLIERLLGEQQRATFVQARALQLRDKARIEYLGPYAEGDLAARASLRPQRPPGRAEEHIARGLGGLL